MIKRRATRERILDSAVALFYAEGIHAVGVDRVVAESCVAKATLYQQFGSKDALVAECLQRHADQWRRDVGEPALARTGSTVQRIGALFEHLAHQFAAPSFRGCPFINAAAEYPDRDGPVAAVIAAHRAEVHGVFSRLLGGLRPARRAELAEELVLLYDGAMVGAELDNGARAARIAKKAAQRLAQTAVSQSL